MSEETTHEVETVFSGKDGPLQAAIGRIVTSGEKLNHVFDRASEMLGGVASIAAVVGGGFSLERSIDSTKEYLASIDRISRLTRESTADTDGLLESMEKVGIEGEFAERIFLGISRKTATAEQHVNALGQATGSTGDMMRRLGVNLNKGPVAALEQMATQVQRGKLGAAELGVAFGVPRTQVVGLMELLQRGPGYIRENVEEARRFGVTVEDLSAFKQMQNAQREIGAAWKRISVIVGSELMPVIADLLKGGADKLKGWVEHAREFGKTMSAFLRDHYQMVLRIGKVMLANFAIQRATGTGIGGHLFGFAGGEGKGEGGGEGARGRGPLAIIPRILGFGFGGVGAIRARESSLGGFKASDFGTIAAIGGRLLSVFRIVGSVVGRFTIIGTVALLAWGAFKAIRDNVLGIRQYFTDLWERLTMKFKAISIALEPLFHAFSSEGTIGSFFSKVVVNVFEGLGTIVERLMDTIHMIINMFKAVSEIGIAAAIRDPMKVFVRAAALTAKDTATAYVREFQKQNAAAAAAKRTTPKERERTPYFDFRGSRFDIKQQFADVDPDRIAVGFANGLGALGERRVQSSFAPLWAV